MKKTKSISLLIFGILLFISAGVSAQDRFPAASEVIKELRNNYSLDEKNGYYKLSKRPVGYVLEVWDYAIDPPKMLKEELFWSSSTHSYLSLTMVSKGKTAADSKCLNDINSAIIERRR